MRVQIKCTVNPAAKKLLLLWQEELSGLFGGVLVFGSKGCEFETHQRHCAVSLSFVFVQSRKTEKQSYMTEQSLTWM